MEEDIKEIKQMLKDFITTYKLKSLKIKADIEYHSKLNTKNPKQWTTEYYSIVNNIDLELKQ